MAVAQKYLFQKRMVNPTKVNDLYSIVNQYSVYPNPAQNNINILLDTKSSGMATMQLIDFTGKIIMTYAVKIQEGINAFTWPVANIANGNYILNILGENIQLHEQILIAK